MKKLLIAALTLVLCAGLAVPALAIAVKSPTQGGTPDVELVSSTFLDADGNPVGDGCEAVLKITPYQDKDNAYSPIIKQSLETAYASYKDDFATSARAMLKAADPAGNWDTKYPGWELQVVNIFDITLLCEQNVHNDDYGVLISVHGDHHVSMELEDSDAANFVALMHYRDEDHDYSTTGDAEWELIETTQEGNEIFFDIQCSNLSPFAIVVKTRADGSDGVISPQTGEADNAGYWVSCCTFLAAAGVTALYRGRKEKRYAR